MKSKIVYIFIFLVVFIFTTGAIIYLNTMYKNIFQMDFSSAAVPDSLKKTDSTKTLSASLNPNSPDSLKKADSLSIAAGHDSTITFLPKNNKSVAQTDQNTANASQNNSTQPENNSQTRPDSSYITWMKQTAKLYENMDPKKAAKIIQSYSDNIARDIIYSMKQKKAADILSELNPDTANRITRAKSNAF